MKGRIAGRAGTLRIINPSSTRNTDGWIRLELEIPRTDRLEVYRINLTYEDFGRLVGRHSDLPVLVDTTSIEKKDKG